MKKIILTIMVFMTLSICSFSVNAETLDSSVSESSATSDVSQDESSSSDVESESSKEESKDPFDGYILIGQIMEKENSISGTLSNLGMICIGAGIFGIVAVIVWSVLSAIAYKKKQKELEKAKRRRKPNGQKRRKPADGEVRKKRPRPADGQVRKRRPRPEIQEDGSTIVIPTDDLVERDYVLDKPIEQEVPKKDVSKYDTQEILREFLDS